MVKTLVLSQFPGVECAGGPACRARRVGQSDLPSRERQVRSPAERRGVCRPDRGRASVAPGAHPEPAAGRPWPVALGLPDARFPWPWSVRRWLPGQALSEVVSRDWTALAAGLAEFLSALRAVSIDGGPGPSAANFCRGGPLTVYDAQTREMISTLSVPTSTPAAPASSGRLRSIRRLPVPRCGSTAMWSSPTCWQ